MLRPELNLTNPPGQIVNTEELDKLAVKKTLTFYEWLTYNYELSVLSNQEINEMHYIWKSAQENS
jgi:hypothetical protein